MRAYKPIDPNALMKRADFMIELLDLWTETLDIIARCPSGTLQELGTKNELEAAIYVLKLTYPVNDLMGFEAYDYVRTTINSMELLQKRYVQECGLIKECAFLGPDEVEQKLKDLEVWRDTELSHLDRRPNDAGVGSDQCITDNSGNLET